MATVKRFQRKDVCKHVRSHESFFSPDPLVEDEFHSGVYWCNKTGDGLGPDGRCANAAECSPTRECFES
jgi:hypothetical protein